MNNIILEEKIKIIDISANECTWNIPDDEIGIERLSSQAPASEPINIYKIY